MVIFEKEPDPCLSFEGLSDGTMRPRYPSGYVPTHEEWVKIVKATDEWYANIDPGYIARVNQYLKGCFDSFYAAPLKNLGPDKSGWIYVLKAGEYYKIGRSQNPIDRYSKLATLPPWPTEIITTFECDDNCEMEKELHDLFSAKRANGEWFTLDAEDVELLRSLE